MNVRAFVVKNKKLFVFLGTTAAVYLGFRFLLPLFVPFIIAYLIALLLRPVVCFMHRWLKIPLILGGVVSVIVLMGAILTGLFFLIKNLIFQLAMFMQNFPAHLEAVMQRLDFICKCCDDWLGLEAGTVRVAAEQGIRSVADSVSEYVQPEITKYSVAAVSLVATVGALLLLMIVAITLITKELCEYREGKRTSSFYPWVSRITGHLSSAGMKYLKVQGILMATIAAICCVGLLIAGNEYALLAGMGIAVFDAFPVLGSGLILVPWTIVSVLSGNYFRAIVLGTVFLLCQIVREYLEPRLLGNTMGIRSVYALMAMYVGVRLFGIIGFLLGPLGLIIIKTVSEAIIEDENIFK